MWKDPVVAAIHRIRQRHAREFGYNLYRLFQDLKREQASSGRTVVSLPRKRERTLVGVRPQVKKL